MSLLSKLRYAPVDWLPVIYGIISKGNGDVFVQKEFVTTIQCAGGMPGQRYPAVAIINKKEIK